MLPMKIGNGMAALWHEVPVCEMAEFRAWLREISETE